MPKTRPTTNLIEVFFLFIRPKLHVGFNSVGETGHLDQHLDLYS